MAVHGMLPKNNVSRDMFRRLKEGSIEPRELQAELERWGLFESYQDRFLAALKR